MQFYNKFNSSSKVGDSDAMIFQKVYGKGFVDSQWIKMKIYFSSIINFFFKRNAALHLFRRFE